MAKVRSLETVSRCWPLGEKAIWVTVKECASRGGPTDVHVAKSHSHTAANCAACACTHQGLHLRLTLNAPVDHFAAGLAGKASSGSTLKGSPKNACVVLLTHGRFRA